MCDLLVELKRIKHCARFDTEGGTCIGAVEENTSVVVVGCGVDDSGTALAGRIAIFNQFNCNAIHFTFYFIVPHDEISCVD